MSAFLLVSNCWGRVLSEAKPIDSAAILMPIFANVAVHFKPLNHALAGWI